MAMTARRVLSLAALALCATVLAGCGDTLSFDPVADAATKTAGTTSSRVEFTATMSIDGVGGMAFSGSGLFDGATRSGALNMRFRLPAEAQSQLGSADPTMQMIMDGHDGLVMYMRSSLFNTVAAGKWLKLDMQALAKKENVDLSALMNANQADPTQQLQMLMASTDAKPVGYDRIRGVFTTHYRFNVDIAKLAKSNDSLRKTFESFQKLTDTTSFPAEAWIDKQGRVRRMKIDMTMNTPVGGAFTMSMTEDLFAFGVKVDVQPPPASQVVDAAALLNARG
jgi:hypothetical protein